MVQFPSGLIITADEPIDCRLVLTSTEMLAISNAIKLDKVGIENESISNYNMPEKYFCVNKDDGRVYYFYFEDTEHCNEWQEETGYFKVSEYFKIVSLNSTRLFNSSFISFILYLLLFKFSINSDIFFIS